jgi:elongation factor Ts
MSFTAQDVMRLREDTGAGMMDCKKAMVESNGDFEKAKEWLKMKGLSAAGKKAGRVTAEGLVATFAEGKSGTILELNSETDFVAKNNQFQALATGLVKEFAATTGDFSAFSEKKAGTISESIAVIGENITLRRAQKVTVSNGVVAQYIHNSVAPGLGKVGVLVALESDAPAEKLDSVGKQIAMHIAATKPESLSIAELDAKIIAQEKAVFAEQARASGKPENVIEKMVEGRLTKFYEQVVLLEQVFVIDGKTKISQVIDNLAKETGKAVKLTGFVRYNLGEGIEKQQTDFAQEVAQAAGI